MLWNYFEKNSGKFIFLKLDPKLWFSLQNENGPLMLIFFHFSSLVFEPFARRKAPAKGRRRGC